MNDAPPYAHALTALAPQKKRYDGPNGTTQYWVYGPDTAETTVVAVHGFRGDHHGLEPILAHLAAGYRVIVPDLPGFGDSPPFTRGVHDLDGYVAWLHDFLRAVAPDAPPVVLGHSFGSIITAASLAQGMNVRALILVNPIGAPALQGPRRFFTWLAILYYWLATVLPEKAGYAVLRSKLVVRGMSAAMIKTRDRHLRRFIHDQHRRYFSVFGHRRVVVEAFDASVRNNVSDFARNIAEPTLLLASNKDDVTPLIAQHRLKGLFPNARLHVICETGHLIHYEAPGEAARVIHAYLDDLASETKGILQPREDQRSDA